MEIGRKIVFLLSRSSDFIKHRAANCTLKTFFSTGKSSKLLQSSAFLAASVIQKNSTLDSLDNLNGDIFKFSHRKLIQQACSGSVNSSSELLTQILLAVIDSATKYKNCLTELMSNLQQNDDLLGYKVDTSLSEEDIITARIQAKNLKEEFLDLVTMVEHIEKLATATAEISFLIGAETLAMLISERLYSVQQQIKHELEEVQKMEKEYLEIQKLSIEESPQDIF